MWSSADIAGPDVFLWFDMTGESLAAAAGDLLGRLSTGASGAADTLVFGVGTLEEGGEGLPPAFSREPLEPKDLSFFNDDDSGIEEPPPRLGRATELRGGAGEVSNSSSTAI